MKKFSYLFILFAFIGISGVSSHSQPKVIEYKVECCKVCTKGKACGDSCISRDYECHKPKGCACDG